MCVHVFAVGHAPWSSHHEAPESAEECSKSLQITSFSLSLSKTHTYWHTHAETLPILETAVFLHLRAGTSSASFLKTKNKPQKKTTSRT